MNQIYNGHEETEQSDKSEVADASEDSKLLRSMRAEVIDAEKLYDDFFKKVKNWNDLAKYGCLKAELANYKSNVTDEVIQQIVASLYAQNPKVKSTLRPRIDNTVWDGTASHLEQAIAVVSMAPQLAMQGINPNTPKIAEADAIVQDALAVHKFKDFLKRKGKTLEILFLYYLDEQTEDFFSNFQRMIRRALVSGVGWVKIGFQREMGFDGAIERKIADQREQIEHMESLDDSAEEADERAADLEEKKHMLAALEEQEIIIREGMFFDFPLHRNMIMDPKAVSWSDLNSAAWLCELHSLTKKEIKARWPKFDITKLDNSSSGEKGKVSAQPIREESNSSKATARGMSKEDFYRVYEYSSKTDGLVYWFIDGCDEYLDEPDVPNVDVEGFFPYQNLIFNTNENEDDTTPVSDVSKMEDAQIALNQKRQWSLDHTKHSLPKYWSVAGALDDEAKAALKTADEVGLVILLKNVIENGKLSDLLQKVETTGLDPNQYATYEQLQDITMSTNASQAQVGNSAKGTATAASISQGAFTQVTDVKKSAVDKLLKWIARRSSQVMQMELSTETVQDIVGRGAIWEESTREDIYKEVMLGIEAGSSGLPNQAEELMKAEKILPLLVQNMNIDPMWLAEKMVELLDSKVDLSEAIVDSPAFAVEQATAEAMSGAGGANQVMGGANAPVLQGGAPSKPSMPHTTQGGYIPSPTQANI